MVSASKDILEVALTTKMTLAADTRALGWDFPPICMRNIGDFSSVSKARSKLSLDMLHGNNWSPGVNLPANKRNCCKDT